MQRVVITGAGLISCIGHDLTTVSASLKQGKSGLAFNPMYQEKGFKACVSGSIDENSLDTSHIDRKLKRFLSKASLYAYLSALQATQQAGLSPDEIAHNPNIGIVAGSGGASSADVVAAVDAMRDKGLRGVGAMAVPKTMASTVSASVATGLKIGGISYSIASACATSTHCVGHAMELIQLGKQQIVIAGGGEQEDWTQSCMFDGMGAMSSKYNETPEKASRAYDANRDGFVIAGGGGAVVLESLEHAQSRGANILAEIVGFGATSDGEDMVAPSGDGAVACMRQAMQGLDAPVDYINTHGTSTPVGDMQEVLAMQAVFGNDVPAFSSTKSLTGHSLGATGAQEAIYCLIMLNKGFIAGSANVESPDPALGSMPLVTTTRDVQLNTILSNSFGFGGTNASLALRRWQGA